MFPFLKLFNTHQPLQVIWFPTCWKSDINSSSNKTSNNERQWGVGGEFLSANLVSALGEVSQNYSFNLFTLNDYWKNVVSVGEIVITKDLKVKNLVNKQVNLHQSSWSHVWCNIKSLSDTYDLFLLTQLIRLSSLPCHNRDLGMADRSLPMFFVLYKAIFPWCNWKSNFPAQCTSISNSSVF